MTAPDLRLTCVILTHNEGKHIQRVLRSLKTLAATAFVVDSFSDDGTPDLARACGAHVVQHRFVNYAQQYQWALENLPLEADWVMRLDADEILTPDLIAELRDRLPGLPGDVTGVNIKRRHIFLGRWIKHGGRYPLVLMRIWRRGAARIEQRWMDEHMVLLRGRAVTFQHDFIDENLNDVSYFIDKHNRYATREAIDVLSQRYQLNDEDQGIHKHDASRQASRKRWLKQEVYNRLPLWSGPLGYFILRFIFQAGFLDGREGLVYHVLQGFWYRFLVASKVFEYEKSMNQVSGAQMRIATLERLTGHTLS